jgi:hypothetical protein
VGGLGGPDSSVSVAAGTEGTASNYCPPGTEVLGGGYFAALPSALRTVGAAYAINDVTGDPGFLVTMYNSGASAETFHVQVRCAAVS